MTDKTEKLLTDIEERRADTIRVTINRADHILGLLDRVKTSDIHSRNTHIWYMNHVKNELQKKDVPMIIVKKTRGWCSEAEGFLFRVANKDYHWFGRTKKEKGGS